ncbi:MAG: Unknown protein [uncultured Thiotrichaceae bacterium]|uniref:Bacterial Ig domain-containing protein n=1 Tax=uncultured Thiotrichaceae bacterium TaxID=298394 RepID=A0A6S6TDK2_9GAMM|nr:MAG: Unknown protein [uncultured Thiotrichaceae bacterium]
MLMRILYTCVFMLSLGLASCGGSDGDSGDGDSTNTNPSTPTTPNTPTEPSVVSTNADSNGLISVQGRAEAGTTITITFPSGSQQTTTADQNGDFTISSTSAQSYGDITVSSTNTEGGTSSATIPSDIVLKTLYQATGLMPELSFEPSLGVNTETPQAGAVTAGNPMPFADIFRTARPFKEFNKKYNDENTLVDANTLFDSNGWPTELDPDLGFIKTKLLQGNLRDSIPDGKYTVMYEGNGLLEFSGEPLVGSAIKVPNENKYILNLQLSDFDETNEAAASETNAINMNIKNITPDSYIKNIRIAMPGGTCTDSSDISNPFVYVDSQADCPTASSYESFAQQLSADRNTIIFNPDYLLFLRNFKTIRMMNLMEASLKDLCHDPENCPPEAGTWENRATLDDAFWGGNDGETAAIEHKGVPIEVIIALANTVKRDIWINIPHVASDDYVTQLSTALYSQLDTSIKVYIEYSNEVWNSGFAAHEYITTKGLALDLGDVPSDYIGSNRDTRYFARLRYHSQRSVEIFNLFSEAFENDSARVVRVLGSFIGDKVLTREMLKNISTDDIDAVAIAPYFFGCAKRSICPDAPKTLLEATTVDDIFDVIDQPGSVDVKALESTIQTISNHLDEMAAYNLELVTYEGGQHLVTGIFGNAITESDKPRLRQLFNAANRDPRMKDRYLQLLNAWKGLFGQGATLFTLYTMPQSYYRFGNFGLKEHLRKPRTESPKFDATLQFQEEADQCWWTNCQ